MIAIEGDRAVLVVWMMVVFLTCLIGTAVSQDVRFDSPVPTSPIPTPTMGPPVTYSVYLPLILRTERYMVYLPVVKNACKKGIHDPTYKKGFMADWR